MSLILNNNERKINQLRMKKKCYKEKIKLGNKIKMKHKCHVLRTNIYVVRHVTYTKLYIINIYCYILREY